MAKKHYIIGYDENGNPIVSPGPRPVQEPTTAVVRPQPGNKLPDRPQPGNRTPQRPQSDRKPAAANIRGRAADGSPLYGLPDRPPEPAYKTASAPPATTDRPQLDRDYSTNPPVQTQGTLPGGSEMLVDYSKTPDRTSVPGQSGYDASADPFRQQMSGTSKTHDQFSAEMWSGQFFKNEKFEFWQTGTGGKKAGGPWGLDLDRHQAASLQHEIDMQMQAAELQFPGAAARMHSSGGINLGDPQIDGQGGSAGYIGLNEWVYRGGSLIGNSGVTIAGTISSWNIYEGQ